MTSSELSYAGCRKYNQDQYHFLEACFLCHKPLGHNSDIFMYRGNTPFCSQECRQEQIEFDEAKERSWKISSKNALRQSTESTQKTSSGPSSKAVRTGTVAVA